MKDTMHTAPMAGRVRVLFYRMSVSSCLRRSARCVHVCVLASRIMVVTQIHDPIRAVAQEVGKAYGAARPRVECNAQPPRLSIRHVIRRSLPSTVAST